MSKRSSVVFKQQQTSPYDKYFEYQSYKIMNKAIEFLNRLDLHKVLTPSSTQFQMLDSIFQRTRGDLKFFHLDVRHNQVYYEILQKEERIVFKRSLNHSKTLHEWRFPRNPLSTSILYEDCKNLAEVLGKVKFLEMKKRNVKHKTTMHIITLKALGNAYINFEEFQLDLEQCINLRLFDVYEGRALNDMHFYQKSDGLHEKVWEFVSIEITRVWHFFNAYVNSENIKEKHTRALYDDFTRLFKTELDNKINRNESVGSLSKKFLQCQKSLGKKPNQISPNILQESHLKAEFTLQGIEQNQIPNDASLMKNFSSYRQSLPQNYPLAKSYFCDSSLQQAAKQYYRTSLKRPANTCNQNCECMKENGRVCENMERKTECENHECSNSQIRLKRDIFCWYLDDDKKRKIADGFADQLSSGFELKEFHAFGLDFYTVRILYYMLPFYKMEVQESKCIEEENVDNEDIKQKIISTFIPYLISKTGNLISAIMSLASDREYRKFHYECKILQKKLRYIKKMELTNMKDTKLKQNLTYPKVSDLKWFYKGLGVINVGRQIPKGKLVGRFIGEILPLWRQEDIQECLFRQYHDKANEIKFYCITAHSHLDQKQSPRVFSVDPQKKGNFCRSLNHSCNPNCKVQVMVSQGKYVLGVYAERSIKEYEELTFDYMSVTDNYEEYLKSVCLCSSLHCRGKYLRYQEEIQSGLDCEFMEKKYSISRRIRELIKCCYEPEMKAGKLQAMLQGDSEGKALCLGLMKHSAQGWFFRWVQKTLSMVQEEIKYVMKKQNKGDPKTESIVRFSQCGKTFESQNNLLEKERLEMLNGKIEKLEHLFSKIKDASPPFEFETKEKLIVYLSSFLKGSKRKEFEIKGDKEMSVNEYKEKVEKLRWELFREGIKELKDGRNIKKAHQFFEAAFTFILIKFHKYPDYRSSPVQIRRENQENLSCTIQCQGENHYILQNLVVWSGEFKRFKQSEIQEKNQNISNTDSKLEINAVTVEFKRSQLIIETKLAISEFQEERFGLKKPAEIKHLQLFLSAVSVGNVEQSLKLWICKEAELITRTKQKPSFGSKSIKNTSVIHKDVITKSFSIKNLKDTSIFLSNQKQKGHSIKLKNQEKLSHKSLKNDTANHHKELKNEQNSESIKIEKIPNVKKSSKKEKTYKIQNKDVKKRNGKGKPKKDANNRELSIKEEESIIDHVIDSNDHAN